MLTQRAWEGPGAVEQTLDSLTHCPALSERHQKDSCPICPATASKLCVAAISAKQVQGVTEENGRPAIRQHDGINVTVAFWLVNLLLTQDYEHLLGSVHRKLLIRHEQSRGLTGRQQGHLTNLPRPSALVSTGDMREQPW